MTQEELELEAEKANGYAYYGKPLGEKYLAFNEGFIAGTKSDVAKKYWYKQLEKEKEKDMIEFYKWVNQPHPKDNRQPSAVYVKNIDMWWHNHKKYTSKEIIKLWKEQQPKKFIMNKILSKEVSFELAKILKEKKIEVNPFGHKYLHHLDKEGNEITDKQIIEKFKGVIPNNDMNAAKSVLSFSFIKAPTIAEVIDWILEKYGIWVSLECDCYGDLWYAKLKVASTENWDNIDKRNDILNSFRKLQEHNLPHDAYQEAIKHILLNFIK